MIIKKHNYVNGWDFLQLLPWVPGNAKRVVIDIPVGDAVMVYVEQYLDVDEITVNALAGLTGGEVVAVSPKPVEPLPARKAPDTSSKTDRLRGPLPAPSRFRLDVSEPPRNFTTSTPEDREG